MASMTGVQSAIAHPFAETDLGLPNRRTGKVREIYPVPGGKLLIVTTDRLSAFDRILGVVAYKGQVLNQLSAWWFERSAQIIPNHFLEAPDPNAMLVTEGVTLPIEVITRAYITGVTKTSLWHRYQLGERTIYGHHFPEGLRKNQALPDPIITPTTKAGPGAHDERLTCDEVTSEGHLDPKIWSQVQEAALSLFALGRKIAARAGLMLVDTKYEFAMQPDGTVMLIDEVHTPDSSRFWEARSYAERLARGEEPESLDKEYLRLEYAKMGYQGNGDPPKMREELWITLSQRYITLYERLTGQKFKRGRYPVGPRLAANLRAQGYLS